MAAFARTELDALGLARPDAQAAVQVFAVRDGKLVGRDVYVLEAPAGATDDEVLAGFVQQYYSRSTHVPPTVLAPFRPADAADLEAFLAAPARAPRPARRPAARREAAPRRARRAQRGRRRSPASRPAGSPTRARRWPRSRSWPPRSACRGRRCGSSATTSATIQGRATGRQHGRLRGRPAADAASTAASGSATSPGRTTSPATRRCCAAASTGAGRARRGAPRSCRWALPDLVVVDGGKGQLAARRRASSRSSGSHDIPIVGLAKEREELFLPGRPEPVVLPADVRRALPRPAAARRGPSLRDHVPPRAAAQGAP